MDMPSGSTVHFVGFLKGNFKPSDMLAGRDSFDIGLNRMHLSIKLAAVGAIVVLTGCASSTASRMGSAASAPLTDLNIGKTDIPDVLANAHKHPYLAPAGQNCVALALEIRELDEALGPDIDEPVAKGEASLFERASGAAQDHAVGAVQRTAEGLVPFRSWVRKLSGAERHSKRVAASVMAGAVRRSFLKGVASAQNCGWRNAANDVAQRQD